MIVRRIFNQWVFDEEKLIEHLNKNGIDYTNNKLAGDALFEDVIGNEKFREYVLEELKQYGEIHHMCLENEYFIKNRILRKIKSVFRNKPRKFDNYMVDSRRLIEYLETKKELTEMELSFLEKIRFFTSSDYIVKELLSKKINSNISYMDLLNFLMKPFEEFEGSMVGNKILGLNIKKVVKILKKKPIYAALPFKSIINRLDVTEEQRKNFNSNFNGLKQMVSKNIVDVEIEEKIEFKPYTTLASNFSLNPELKKKIMNQVPEHFTTLQKAYFIYKLLCQEFSYDEEFFYLKYCVPSKNHLDFSRLSDLVGGEEVICTGFSLVYAKFLELLGLPFATLDYDDKKVTKLSTKHIKIRFKVDDYIVDADGATDLFESDMVSQKTRNETLHFRLLSNDQSEQLAFESQKAEVDEYFEKIRDENEYNQAIDMYRQIYFGNNKEYTTLSFDERIKLILDIIMNSKLRFFDMINLCADLRLKIMDDLSKMKIEFIVNKTRLFDITSRFKHELNILIAYNEDNDLYDDFDGNSYLIITPDRNIERLTYQELKRRFSNSTYDFTNEKRNLLNLKEGEDIGDRRSISRRTSL